MEDEGGLPGGGITLGYSKFQDIPEEIKEEEDFESEMYQDRSNNNNNE